jgi:Bcr/CflA subfamily drug resistance transporter
MEKKFPFLPILMLSTIGMVATDFYLPSLPFIQTHFQALKSSVQLSLTLYLLGFSISQFFYGPLSERYGRKPVVLTGLAIGYLGSTLCLFSPSLTWLNVGRFIEGLGFGAGAALWRTIIRDVYTGEALARIGAWTATASSIAMALAPILGGLIQRSLGWRAVFALFGLYACITFYALWKRLPETRASFDLLALQPKNFFQNYRHLITNSIFLGYSGAGSLAFAGFAAYFASSPFLFEQVLHLSPEKYGFLACFLAIGLSIGGIANSRLIPLFGRHRLLVTGTVILFLSSLLMLFLGIFYPFSIFTLMLPMSLYACGCAFVFANSFAGAFFPFAHIAGFAGALYGTLQIFSGSLSSGWMTLFHETNQIPLSLLLMVLSVGTYFLQWLAFRATS